MSPKIVDAKTFQKAASSAPGVIRVKNLQTSIRGPADAWGRPHRYQPLTVSAEIYLRKPFHQSSADDSVAADTVHYGILSKKLLTAVEDWNDRPVTGVLDDLSPVAMHLLGQIARLELLDEKFSSKEPMVTGRVAELIRLELSLPKASLLGGRVSFVVGGKFASEDSIDGLEIFSFTASVHELRVPTLIGVNANEREAKQVVIATIEVDRVSCPGPEFDFAALEREVVQAMEESSFETLEALSVLLARRLRRHLESRYHPVSPNGWPLRIELEKPTAITFADASCVELRTATADVPLES